MIRQPVGVQYNRKWPHEFCIIIEANSQKTFHCIVLYTNMAAVTSDPNYQLSPEPAIVDLQRISKETDNNAAMYNCWWMNKRSQLEIFFFSSTNMAAMTSSENHLYRWDTFRWFMIWNHRVTKIAAYQFNIKVV